jgi:hypothetical protein
MSMTFWKYWHVELELKTMLLGITPKTGTFSVRLAYHLKQHLNKMAARRACSSLNCIKHRGWLSLWAAYVPSKVKLHCWRLTKHGLAVGEELREEDKRWVHCIVYNREDTLCQRFWDCPHLIRTCNWFWGVIFNCTSRRLSFLGRTDTSQTYL